jgi:outer membrane protein TolC
VYAVNLKSNKSIKILGISLFLLVFIVGGTIGAKAQVNKVMTLKEAVAIGVSTNPEYGVVATNRRATDEELRQARALYLPSLDLRADTGYDDTYTVII